MLPALMVRVMTPLARARFQVPSVTVFRFSKKKSKKQTQNLPGTNNPATSATLTSHPVGYVTSITTPNDTSSTTVSTSSGGGGILVLPTDHISSSNHPLAQAIKDKRAAATVIGEIGAMAPQQRREALTAEFLSSIAATWSSSEAAAIIAALYDGQKAFKWNDGAVQTWKGGYTSPVWRAMGNRLAGPIQPLADTEVSSGMLCFEFVAYAAYAAGALSSDQVQSLLEFAIPKGAGNAYREDQKNMPRLWAALGHRSGNIPVGVDALGELGEGLHEPGRLVFFGPKSGDGRGFDSDVPWHVGILMGDGTFDGNPGSGDAKWPVRESLVDYLQKTNHVVSLGWPIE